MQEFPRLYVSDFLDGLYNKPCTNTFVTFWYQNYEIIFIFIFTVAPIIVPGNAVDEQKKKTFIYPSWVSWISHVQIFSHVFEHVCFPDNCKV